MTHYHHHRGSFTQRFCPFISLNSSITGLSSRVERRVHKYARFFSYGVEVSLTLLLRTCVFLTRDVGYYVKECPYIIMTTKNFRIVIHEPF